MESYRAQPYRVPVTEGDRIRADAALHLAAYAFGVPASEMLRRERTRPRACRARSLMPPARSCIRVSAGHADTGEPCPGPPVSRSLPSCLAAQSDQERVPSG